MQTVKKGNRVQFIRVTSIKPEFNFDEDGNKISQKIGTGINKTNIIGSMATDSLQNIILNKTLTVKKKNGAVVFIKEYDCLDEDSFMNLEEFKSVFPKLRKISDEIDKKRDFDILHGAYDQLNTLINTIGTYDSDKLTSDNYFNLIEKVDVLKKAVNKNYKNISS